MRYWVYLNGEVPGTFEPEELAATPGFAMTTLVCPAEGEILEKNWRRAGEFEDLERSLQSRDARAARAAEPPQASVLAAPPPPGGLDALLDATGARLFTHVAGLMKELEGRREERALAVGLQRQLKALRDEAAALRAQAAADEARLARLPGLEAELARARSDAAASREGLAALEQTRAAAAKAAAELEDARRRLDEAAVELAAGDRRANALARESREKGQSLAKALDLIGRLEGELQGLDAAPPAAARAQSPLPSVPPDADEPSASFAADEPPAPADSLRRILRRVFPGQ